MKVSTLVEQLEVFKREHGDVEILLTTANSDKDDLFHGLNTISLLHDALEQKDSCVLAAQSL